MVIPQSRRPRWSLSTFLVLAVSLSTQSVSSQNRFTELHRDSTRLDTVLIRALAAGDLDGDGDLDLVLNRSGHDMLRLNQGDGMFVDASSNLPSGGVVAAGVALGDLDGDGDLDIVIGHNRNRDQVLLNDGSARFTDVTSNEVANAAGTTTTVVLADLDGDGDLDLLFGSQSQFATHSRFFLNNGRAQFRAPQNSRLPNQTSHIHPVDVDSDGDLDLVVIARGQLSLLQNDGRARFVDITSGRIPAMVVPARWVEAADIDLDGDIDLVLGSWGRGVRLLENNGSTSFTDTSAQHVTPSPDRVRVLKLADFDGDADLDILSVGSEDPNGRGGLDHLYLNDGAGNFVASGSAPDFQAPTLTLAVAVGDFDGDGDVDAVFAGEVERMRTYFNVGNGRLEDVDKPAIPEDIQATTCVDAADIDRDGDIDLCISNEGQRLRLYVNDGRGKFSDVTNSQMPKTHGGAIAALFVDVDGDQYPDLVVGSELYLNDRTGRFTLSALGVTAFHYSVTRAIAAGDVNGDGHNDIVIGKQMVRNRLYLGDGRGGFVDATSSSMPIDTDDTRALELGDVDGDGDLDIVLGNYAAYSGYLGHNRLYINDGQGVFRDAPKKIEVSTGFTEEVELFDADGDGDLDIVFANIWMDALGDPSEILLNDGQGNFKRKVNGLPYLRTLSEDVAVGDIDEDGDLDLVFSNLIDIRATAGQSPQNRLMLNNGNGQFTDGTASWLPKRDDFSNGVVLFDADGDRDLDVWFGNSPNGSGIGVKLHDRFYTCMNRHLHSPGFARPGQPYKLTVHTSWNTTTRPVLVLPWLSGRVGRFDMGPMGVVGIDPSTTLFLPSQTFMSGKQELAVQVMLPKTPALQGVTLFSQALIIDPGLAPTLGMRLTNTVMNVVF